MNLGTRSLLACGVLAAACWTAACFSEEETVGPDEPAGPTADVEMRDNSFSPRTARVLAGGVVTWTNRGVVQHNSISNSGPWSSGLVNPSGTFQRTFPARGTFDYFCSLHAGMTATIIVE